MTKDEKIAELEAEVIELHKRVRRLEKPNEYYWSKEEMECLINSFEYHIKECRREQRRMERKIDSYDKMKSFFGCK